MNLKNDSANLLENLRPVQILFKSFENQRLPHGILLHGENTDTLSSISFALAKRLLNTTKEPSSHPDFFSVRPSNKMRQISADTIRDLIKKIQQSPNQGGRKVALIYDADRMNTTASNAFLKTLEEPPPNTTIFLITSRPYNLLDTIRSRCFNFKIPILLKSLDNPAWSDWLADYSNWIKESLTLSSNNISTSDIVLKIYALVSRFETVLDELSTLEWKSFKESLSEEITDEEKDAMESGIFKKNRNLLFTDIEKQTLSVALSAKPSPPSRKLDRVITHLEHLKNLFEVNLNESTALEAFLLDSLRVWSLQS